IGTAKPDASTLHKYPHNLVDLIGPTEAYSAARFCSDALAAMSDIVSRGKTPLLVGGTMLYAKALLEGLSKLPEADPIVRAELEAEAQEKGWPAMHAELARVDPAAAARLQPADAQRVQRALEVFRITGEPISQLQTGAADAPEFPYDALQIGLVPSERSVLHERIAERFDAMLQRGLVEELRGLQQRYALRADMPAMRCVGYRQAWSFLKGECDEVAMREQGIAATRQLAKRQLTWLRSMSQVLTIDCLREDLSAVAADWVARLFQYGVEPVSAEASDR
ncbi:MAG: tRNA (adenosine(37)-N6)-dimethylallyltransferase MiaA, partial [Betaproteobacteria bacterium]|nr:tRNA (adenosine(37)-N6)-dimethylallyltransferase MiaA [Betaproteobacteria bacterium]